MADNKLRACVIVRLEALGSTMLSKYDHGGESDSGGSSSLYGGGKDFAETVKSAMEKDPPSHLSGKFGGFKVVQADPHQLIYGADVSGVCIGIITGLRYPSRVIITMLQELYADFHSQYAMDASMAPPNSLTKKTRVLLSEYCKKYADPANVDKAQKVLASVDKVKNQMAENIAGMLANTEKAQVLAEKSEALEKEAAVFQKNSATLKKTMQWKSRKMTIIMVSIVAGILFCILVPLIIEAKNRQI